MAVEAEKFGSDGKLWNLCKRPFWHSRNAAPPPYSSSSSSSSNLSSMHNGHQLSRIHESVERPVLYSGSTVSYVAKSLLPARRRLRLDPPNKLFFPCTPPYLQLCLVLNDCFDLGFVLLLK